jgi:hypothetical protein
MMAVSQNVAVMENGAARPQPAAQGEAMQRVCRRERVTGSNFSRRVCTDRAASARERDDAREGLRRLQGSRLPDGQ